MTDPITRLNAALEGRYRIERQLGEGGMATVYLARDLKHNRKVALKVLKPDLAAVVGADRFLAEIETTASLQHPHILPLFDSGEADSFLFYVMPYVEGESLRERLDREHQLPVDEAVSIATKVAGALQAAHERGVIHRDIKPANILLAKGEPLVSDFGIALAVNAGGAGRLTETGLSLGTPHYMSPEQATGDLSVGAASDIYALGCVLYEMLVGEPPFTGSTPQAVLGKIVTGDADTVTKHRHSVAVNVDAAIRRALEKVPADRFTGADEFARALADPSFRHGVLGATGAVGGGSWNRLTVTFAALFVVASTIAVWPLIGPEPGADVMRFSLVPFADFGERPALGEFMAQDSVWIFMAPGPSGPQLWRRRMSDLEASPIRGTEGVVTFTLSPDEREVAIVRGFPGPLVVVPLDGGPGRTVADAVMAVWDWAPDRTLYVTAVRNLLTRISAVGDGQQTGEPIFTRRNQGEFIYGQFSLLPGATMGVFQVWRAADGSDAEIWVVNLETGERSFVVAGNTPRYMASGHLLFGTPAGGLMAAPIDPGSGQLLSTPVLVAENVVTSPAFGASQYTISDQGTLMYGSGGRRRETAELIWVSRSGEAVVVDPTWNFRPPNQDYGWSLSADGDRVAITHVADGNPDIWIKQLPNGPFERLTFDDGNDRYPAWTPDDEFVTYVRGLVLWRRRTDGIEDPELLLTHRGIPAQARWSPDGEWLVFRNIAGDPRRRDVFGFRPGIDSVALPLAADQEAGEQAPAVSPDGRWLAYTSDRTGRQEVYVSAFPDVGSSSVRISNGGGLLPVWAHSGNELFFVDGERRMIAAQLRVGSEMSVVERETLFTLGSDYLFLDGGEDFYDVAPDDQRFLMARYQRSGEDAHIVMVQNFVEELKRLLPAN